MQIQFPRSALIRAPVSEGFDILAARFGQPCACACRPGHGPTGAQRNGCR
jgi:hypothetical protein